MNAETADFPAVGGQARRLNGKPPEDPRELPNGCPLSCRLVQNTPSIAPQACTQEKGRSEDDGKLTSMGASGIDPVNNLLRTRSTICF